MEEGEWFPCISLEQHSPEYLAHTFENCCSCVRFRFSENAKRQINEIIHEEDRPFFPIPWGIHNLFQKTED